MLVVADSNALMSIFRLGINIDEALSQILPSWEMRVPQQVFAELERLAETNRHARAALSLAKKCSIITGYFGEADAVVVLIALEQKGVVFTNDRDVLRRAKDLGVPRIYFRGGSRLVLEGMLI